MPARYDYRLPDDPRELTILLENLRVRILPMTEALNVTHAETQTLHADHAALAQAVRATDEAEALAAEWRQFRDRLIHSGEAIIQPPAPTLIPHVTGQRATTLRETRMPAAGPGMGSVRAGVGPRLQAFVARLIAHPNATDRTLLDLGLLPQATVGFSPGHEPDE